MMDPASRVYVAGHRGLVGSAIVRRLLKNDYDKIITRTRYELDLRDRDAVHGFFNMERPEYVFLAAAKVGGIAANARAPVEFLLDNLRIQNNVIEAAWKHDVRKLLFLGSSCIYPKLAPQPIREESLLTGPLEPTNRAYAIAKLAGLELVSALRQEYGFSAVSVMPTNLYGPGDNFDPETSHVLPGMIRKIHEAKATDKEQVVLWGTGAPRRELLHVDDLADAAVLIMHNYDWNEPLNIGTGIDMTIRELADHVADAIGFMGDIQFDGSKPDGTPRKLLDCSRIAELGWAPRITLPDGIAHTYKWFLENCA
jgi:GDP-L-fucose synthase